MTPISREKKALSKENILQLDVFNEIDVWPLIKRPNGQYDTRTFWKEYSDRLSDISKIVEEFVNRQRIVVSWLLAVIFGLLGNLLVNLFFSSILFEFSIWSRLLLIITPLLMIISVLGLFLYYPTTCSFSITYFPLITANLSDSPAKLAKLPEKLQSANLSARAKKFSNQGFFIDLILGYAGVISLAILRNQMKSTKIETIQVRPLKPVSAGLSIYTLTFDLSHHKSSFWHRGIDEKIRKEFTDVTGSIMTAKRCTNYDIDQDADHWNTRGHLFLNEIAEWDLKKITEQIEKQIQLNNSSKTRLDSHLNG